MPKDRKLVMVTNDDSIQSNGIIDLARAVASHAEVVIVAPEQPMSATAMSMTFHKPLRVNKVQKGEFECYAVSGSPGDCVMIGINKILPRRPDLVVSGINIGDNNTFQDVMASGTVAAAFEAAITGIPSIAFSLLVDEEALFALEYDQPDFSGAALFAGEIAGDVLSHGMPEGAELLNVNFPSGVTAATEIEITEVGRRKYTDQVIVRKDPRGRPYYWLFGERLSHFPSKTDADAVLTRRKVSITPIVLNLSGPPSSGLEDLRERVRASVRSKLSGRRLRDK
ncbi:MAG: 5'/3'-nucleotidase SurE [Thaumarchaeota archaeon]|nr:5'/3'-nucleotidase SurE [Nitrososphaerota archaeon]